MLVLVALLAEGSRVVFLVALVRSGVNRSQGQSRPRSARVCLRPQGFRTGVHGQASVVALMSFAVPSWDGPADGKGLAVDVAVRHRCAAVQRPAITSGFWQQSRSRPSRYATERLLLCWLCHAKYVC
jgi:hypothetical protein